MTIAGLEELLDASIRYTAGLPDVQALQTRAGLLGENIVSLSIKNGSSLLGQTVLGKGLGDLMLWMPMSNVQAPQEVYCVFFLNTKGCYG